MAHTLADHPTAVAAPALRLADTLLGVLIFAAMAAATGWFLLRMTASWLGVLTVPGLVLAGGVAVAAAPRRFRLAALAVAVLAVPAAAVLLT
jgi:hypothetical protein